MKPFYAISIFFLFVLIGCQYLYQNPEQVKELEKDAENMVEVAIEAQGATGSLN